MLTGLLTNEGLLKIKRAGTMKYQYCPYHPAGLECGDWCPQFREPAELSGSTIVIELCNDTKITFHSLTDLREKKGKKAQKRVTEEVV
jgi:hypothetical protein